MARMLCCLPFAVSFLFSLLFSLLLALPARLPAQAAVLAKPNEWVPRDMLASLAPALRDERRQAVEVALQLFPQSAETLLLALLTPKYQDAVWASAGKLLGPADPAGYTHYPGRGLVIAGAASGAALPGVTVTARNESFQAFEYTYVSPLLLDLNSDGSPGVAGGRWEPHSGADFTGLLVADVNYDGYPELTEWVDGTDGLLVDPSDPSKVSIGAAGPVWNGSWSGRDLVGTAEGYRDGFEKLALRDTNHDGAITGAELAGLFVWKDADTDAEIDAGELKRLAGHGITQLQLPAPGEATGTFVGEGRVSSLWDWWPSYALAKKVPSGPVVGPRLETVQFNPKEITVDKQISNVLTPDAEGWISRAALEEAGFHWGTLLITGLAPDGSRLLLLDRGVTAEQVQAGKASLMWSMMAQDNTSLGGGRLAATAHFLPLPAIRQAVFRSRDQVLFVGGNDGLLDLDLVAGTATHHQNPADAGFRAGAVAFRSGEDVYLTGYFHDAKQVGGPDSIARLMTVDGGGSVSHGLVQAATLDAMYSRLPAVVTGFRAVRMHILVRPDLAYFVVQRDNAEAPALAMVRGGTALLIDQRVTLGGIAASGNRVLYFRLPGQGVGGLDVAVEAVVHDVVTGESRVIASGDLSYPYLARGGNVAVLARMDWNAEAGQGGTITLMASSSAAPAEPILTATGIGALRVSEDGSTYAFLGPRGLKIGLLPGAGGPRFLRGNANGSPLSESARQAIDISDAIFLLASLFLGGPAPPCLAAADANDDGAADISDAVKILSHLFGGTPADAILAPPWPEPGTDPTADALGCETPQG